MTDYNLLAKAEIEKYRKIFGGTEKVNLGKSKSDKEAAKIVMGWRFVKSKECATTAIQGIIDALEELQTRFPVNSEDGRDYVIVNNKITHYTTLKQHIENYKL